MGAWDYVSTLTLDTNGYDEQLNKAVKSTKKFQEQTEQTNKELADLRKEGGKTQDFVQGFGKQMGLSDKSVLKFSKGVKAAGVAVAGVTVAVTAAVKIVEGYGKALQSSGAGANKWNQMQAELNETINLFWQSLANGSISGFITNLREVGDAAKEAQRDVDALARAKLFTEITDEGLKARKSYLELRLTDSNLTVDELHSISEELRVIAEEFGKSGDMRINKTQESIDSQIDLWLAKIGSYTGMESLDKNAAKQLFKQMLSTPEGQRKLAEYGGLTSDQIKSGYYQKVKIWDNSQVEIEPGKYMTVGLPTYEDRWSTDPNTLATAAVKYMATEVNDVFKDMVTYTQQKNDAAYNEQRDINNIIDKDIAERIARLEELQANGGKTNKEVLAEIQTLRTKNLTEFANNYKKYVKTTSYSGISNDDARFKNIMESLTDRQIGKLNDLWGEFEEKVNSIEQQLSSEQVNTEEYENKMLLLINNLLTDVGYISSDLAAELKKTLPAVIKREDSKTTTTPIMNAEMVRAGLLSESNYVEEQLFKAATSNMVKYYNKDQLVDISKSKDYEDIASWFLSNMQVLNATGDGKQGVDNWAGWNMDDKSLSEKIVMIERAQQIFNDSYERYKAAFSGDDLTNITEIYTSNNQALAGALDSLYEKYDAIYELQERLNLEAKKMEGIADIVNGVGNAFSAWSGVFDDATAQWVNWVGTFISGIGEMLPHIQTLIAAKHAESLAEGTAGAAKVPFPGNIPAILSIIGIIGSIFASMPKFAGGGIFDGVTSMGDYNIARVNKGEMILNSTQQGRLFRMLNSGNPDHTSNVSGDVTFKIQGTQLVGVLNNYNKIHSRSI